MDLEPSQRMQPFCQPSIFSEIRKWSIENNAIDIASGAPNWQTPKFVKENLNKIVQEDQDQYGVPGGELKLKQQILNYIQDTVKLPNLDAAQNVYIGQGASGVLEDVCKGYLNPGDEVIVFDPHFPQHSYSPKIYGAVIKSVNLIQPQNSEDTWKIDFDELEKAFNEKTRQLWICSPHNPTGKIYTKEEYQKIAQILQKFPKVLVVSDEVYDILTFDNTKFTRFAETSTEMAQRTVTVGSLGKTFSCTGWRVGYAIARPDIIKTLISCQAHGIYSIFKPVQLAFGQSLDQINDPYENKASYKEYASQQFQSHRDYIAQKFSQIENFKEWNIIKVEGGYFLIIDIKNLIPKIPMKYFYKEKHQDQNSPINKQFEELDNPDFSPDMAFLKFLLFEYQVAVMNTTHFYSTPNKNHSLVRVSLAKNLSSYEEAFKRLNKQQ